MMDIQNILYMVSLGSCKSEDIYIRRCSARVSSKGKMGGADELWKSKGRGRD